MGYVALRQRVDLPFGGQRRGAIPSQLAGHLSSAVESGQARGKTHRIRRDRHRELYEQDRKQRAFVEHIHRHHQLHSGAGRGVGLHGADALGSAAVLDPGLVALAALVE